MDRRSWLWRRRSSEKSPSGETESSGSLSSHSERFSDEQTLSNHNFQSPEVTSKTVPDAEDHNDSLKSLTEKLSEALLDIHTKEELVKQHAKVAEEAVTGWERAEKEVSVLKKQTDTLTQKNSFLEDRVGQLDGALKECLRQLRQAREEQEEKIYEVVANKTREWESKKFELENQLAELHSQQLQSSKIDVVNSKLANACSKLEAAEKENSILKLKLVSKSEEMELRTCERDLSTRAAESASKQHLDSIKKVTKLEAECRRLKMVACKAIPTSNNRLMTASLVYVESSEENPCTRKTSRRDSIDGEPYHPDSCSNALESNVGQCKNIKSLVRSGISPIIEADFMDDFLEMERIVALPEIQGECSHDMEVNGEEEARKDELKAMINRTAELEENIERMETEKINLETTLSECLIQLKTSEDRNKLTEAKLVELRTKLMLAIEENIAAEKEAEFTKEKLKTSIGSLEEANVRTVQMQKQLTDSKKESISLVMELDNANQKKMEAELQLKVVKLEMEKLDSSICALENEISTERRLSREAASKCEKLERELSRMKLDYEFQRSEVVEQFKINQDKELDMAKRKFAECQKTIASLDRQIKNLATLDDFLIDSRKHEVT